jgi:predicted nucleic acid-binding protein
VKIVFDTNVLFAALVSKSGFCADVLNATITRHTLVISDHILGELRRHLAGNRKLAPHQINSAIKGIADAATIVSPTTIPMDVVPRSG